jgi:hypothetical protein
MSFDERMNRFWIGLVAGILFPALMFFFYWMFFHSQMGFPRRFLYYLLNGYLLSNVVKVCGLGNLLLFYFGLKRKMDDFNKGIIVSILVYIALVAYVTYYLEPEYL